MAIIAQQTLFAWSDFEELGDLERLTLVIEYMPDEELMRILEKERKNGRDDYPLRALWNTILAGIVFQHISVESLRRELARNAQLRFLCGLYSAVPPEWVYTRFLKKLMKHEKEIEKMFENLVDGLYKVIVDFGKDLAIDSKAISSLAKHRNKKQSADGRRDTDANYGHKEYRGTRENGTAWEKIVKWFGYKIHLLVDSNYDLPVAYSITKASEADINEAHKIIETLEKERPEILENCETLEADRGYDDTKLIVNLWNTYKIKPVIQIRDMWKDFEETRLLTGYANIVYDYTGHVYCYCMKTGEKREMIPGGFEEDRDTLKKLCPAKHYGFECRSEEECPIKKAIRIRLEEDRRIFTPIDRASYKWEKYYNKRTSVERVNSRIDESFGFEKHYIRGEDKMKVRCGLALCVMLAMAVGRIKNQQYDKFRSLVKSA